MSRLRLFPTNTSRKDMLQTINYSVKTKVYNIEAQAHST